MGSRVWKLQVMSKSGNFFTSVVLKCGSVISDIPIFWETVRNFCPPHPPRPAESETLGVGPRHLHCTNPLAHSVCAYVWVALTFMSSSCLMVIFFLNGYRDKVERVRSRAQWVYAPAPFSMVETSLAGLMSRPPLPVPSMWNTGDCAAASEPGPESSHL